jgi:hypothetical protein
MADDELFGENELGLEEEEENEIEEDDFDKSQIVIPDFDSNIKIVDEAVEIGKKSSWKANLCYFVHFA